MDSEHGHQWSETIGARHIFIKELFAAVFAIRHCLATFPKSLEIHIGIDNTAAAAALRNMYSGNVMACEVLDKLSAELSAHNASIHVHGLRSEDNASDPASRGKTASKELVKECFRIMLAAEKGHRINVPSEYNPTTAAGGIRHHESSKWLQKSTITAKHDLWAAMRAVGCVRGSPSHVGTAETLDCLRFFRWRLSVTCSSASSKCE